MEKCEINKAGFRLDALNSALSYAMSVDSDKKPDHVEVLNMAKEFSDFLLKGEVPRQK